MPVWVRIKLSDEDKAMLSMWTSSGKTGQRLAKRATVILLSNEGVPLSEISARTGLTRKVCSKRRKRFAELGIPGLSDMPGRGRPKVYDAESRVDALVLCVDEKSQLQALDRTQPLLTKRHGTLRRCLTRACDR